MVDANIFIGNVFDKLAELPDKSVRTVITSPPYWGLRDYGSDGQLGLESTPQEYVDNMVRVFREVWRVLADDGTLWLNVGDSYNNKNLVGVPWLLAFALQNDGWYLRQDIIWAKPSPMPEPSRDRCTRSHEYLFLLTKSSKYYFDYEAIREPATSKGDGHRFGGNKYNDTKEKFTDKNGSIYRSDGKRNKRDVWFIPSQPFKNAHFAVMPEALAEPCVLAGSAEGDTILDPFAGSGTTGVVSLRHKRNFIGIELNPEYARLARDRIKDSSPLFNNVVLVGEE